MSASVRFSCTATMPLRMRDEPSTAAGVIADARSRLCRMLAMSQGTEAFLQEREGCEVNREHMLAVFDAIVEDGWHALSLLDKARAELNGGVS